jgi:signal transduction histidine kinase
MSTVSDISAPAPAPPALTTRDAQSAEARPAADRPELTARRQRALAQEVIVRFAVVVVMMLFNELQTTGDHTREVIRVTALIGLLFNAAYYVAGRTGRALRGQAYVRMSLDVAFLTAGLYAAGGLAAAPYVAVYATVPVYTGIVFSSRACIVVTLLATGSFLAVCGLQVGGVLRISRPLPSDAWEIASFNLLILNIVGGLAAFLAEAYRRSRQRLATLHAELERAHDESLRLNRHIQRAARFEALSEVVAGVTHEMRNVLTGAFGHLYLLREKLTSPATRDLDHHVSQVERCCHDAMRIIQRTLEVARQPGPEREPVAIADVIARVVELKRYDLRRDDIALRVDVAEPVPTVVTSAFQVQQVLLNLVTNAQDELRRGSGRREIVIGLAAGTDGCLIEVADSGRGIPPEVLPRLFEPFFTTKDDGTGLGLAISAGIAEGLGGRLTAANRAEGGAIFRLALPVTR